MPDSDLDYVHVTGRIAMSVGDSVSDSGLNPDLVPPDIGAEVWFTPQAQIQLAAEANPPATIVHSVIKVPVSETGELHWNQLEDPGVWLIDLGSDKLNPKVPRDQAAYYVEFKNFSFGGVTRNVAPFYCHPLPGVENDISDMMPVPTGAPVAITRGPAGEGVAVSASVAGDPPSIAAGAQGSMVLTVAGALVGDAVVVSPRTAPEAGLAIDWAGVTAADTVTVRLSNRSGSALDGASRLWEVRLLRA